MNRFRSAFLALGLAGASSCPALACSVCFGSGNEELARGFYWGILLLLLLPAALITGIGARIYLSARKKASARTL